MSFLLFHQTLISHLTAPETRFRQEGQEYFLLPEKSWVISSKTLLANTLESNVVLR